MKKSIFIFGAGKIGRSFIGQLFGRSGYEVIFSDVDKELVRALNKRSSYPVVIKSDKEEHLQIKNVRAIHTDEEKEMVQAIKDCSIAAISVGKNAIIKIIPTLAKGIVKRFEAKPTSTLDIIIAENMRDSAEFIGRELGKILPPDFPFNRVGLIETSIGKMVPIMTQEDLKGDPLIVFAEPYNELLLDRRAFKGEIPDVRGFSLKDNIKAWVDAKAFIHNLGHATVAYYGNYMHPGREYIFEALEDEKIYNFSRQVMFQSAKVLEKLYPEDFTKKELATYIDDLLGRFQNKFLKDTVFRVGQDRVRKLSPSDRFVGIIRLAINNSMEYNHILEAMCYAFHFKATDEKGIRSEGDILFDEYLSLGIGYVLQKVCGFDPVNDAALIEQCKRIIKSK